MKYNVILISIIHRNNYEILLIKRKRDPGKDMWSLPGGGGAFGTESNPAKAIAKEVYSDFMVEYTNYDFLTMQYLDSPEPTICLYYQGEINGKPQIGGVNTIKEIKWVSIDDVIKTELAFEKTDKEVIRMFKEKFLSK